MFSVFPVDVPTRKTHSKTHFADFVVENMPFVVSFAYRSRISVAAVLSAVGRARNLRSLIALSGEIVFNMPAHIDRKRCLRLSAALFPCRKISILVRDSNLILQKRPGLIMIHTIVENCHVNFIVKLSLILLLKSSKFYRKKGVRK